MDLLQVIILALIQGITEFLPVSSSAHLILPSEVLGWQYQGLAFDVAVHVGTLVAVMLYFRHDLVRLLRAWLRQVSGGGGSADARLAWFVGLGSVPTLAAGFFLNDLIVGALHSALVIGLATVFFGVLLQWADSTGVRLRRLDEMDTRTVAVIAFAQILALIPGTSRSGITITAGLAMGLTRESAARFSFLLSIPVILGAGAVKTVDLAQGGTEGQWLAAGIGAVLAGVSAYLCIHWFLGFVQRASMWPFTIYRLLLGTCLITYALV